MLLPDPPLIASTPLIGQYAIDSRAYSSYSLWCKGVERKKERGVSRCCNCKKKKEKKKEKSVLSGQRVVGR
ncbi:unnamed protein product [Jaminaea pallidilutea]